jgi:hypothetical protein
MVGGDERNYGAKALWFKRDSLHWEGCWVGHLYLPLECGKDEEVIILGADC